MKLISSEGSSSLPKKSSVWLIIFADLVALLLTFFVMLFSMSNVTEESWKRMVEALTKELKPVKWAEVDQLSIQNDKKTSVTSTH